MPQQTLLSAGRRVGSCFRRNDGNGCGGEIEKQTRVPAPEPVRSILAASPWAPHHVRGTSVFWFCATPAPTITVAPDLIRGLLAARQAAAHASICWTASGFLLSQERRCWMGRGNSQSRRRVPAPEPGPRGVTRKHPPHRPGPRITCGARKLFLRGGRGPVACAA